MKIKQLLTKTLLVAVGLLAGQSVWADKTFLPTMTGTVGPTDLTGAWWTNCSKAMTIADGETYVISLINHNNPTSGYSHANFYIEMSDWTAEGYCDAQIDGGANPWGGSLFTEMTQTGKWDDYFPTVTEWNAAYNGVKVTITVSRSGNVITASHAATCKDANSTNYSGSFSTTYTGSGDVSFYIVAAANAYQEITNVVYTEADGTTTHTYASAIDALPFSRTWTASDVDGTSPFDAGTVKTGTNVTALSVNNTTATAWFDSDTNTDGTQPYTLVTDEEVTISFTAYHGWMSGGSTQGVKVINSEGNTLAEYVYNVGSCNITDVKIGGTTATQFTAAYNGQSKINNNANKSGANGLTNNAYLAAAGWNPVITIKVRYDGYVTININRTTGGQYNFDYTYTGNLPAGWAKDLQKIQAYANSNNDDRTLAINNLSISSAVQERANYTVKFVDEGGDEIADEAVYSGVVDSEINLLSGDKANRYNAGNTKKYTYASDDSEGKTVAANGSTVVTVTFDTHSTYDYSVTNSLGQTIDSGTLFDDETKKVSWPKYLLYNGIYYVTSADYQTTISSSNKTKSVTYSPSVVCQFVEATSSNWASTEDATVKYSNGTAYRGNVTKTMLTVAESGKYNIIYAVCSSNVGDGKEFDFTVYKNSATEENKLDVQSVNHSYSYINSTGTYKVENVSLAENDKILIASGASSGVLDYVALEKTDATVTIASSGYSSLGSAYGLDFANATTSTDGAVALTAFAATESTETSVKLVSIDEAPAATGVILKGTPGATYTIPVKANAAALTVTNLLHAAVTATNIVGNTSYIMQGGQFHLVTEASTVPAGKAYLQAAPGSAKALTVVFVDDLTGVANVNAAEAVQPVKRIVNGQLVIEKNGKRFNAAGAEF